jgi:hypothetical protein
MRHMARVVVAVGLAGLGGPAVGQTTPVRRDLPDPAEVLLPPVSNNRRPVDDRYPDDDPPPKTRRVQPIPPVSRDDDPPPNRRPAPRDYDDDPPPPKPRRPAPRPADDYDDPPRPARRPASADDRQYDDELPPPRPPQRPAARLSSPSGVRTVSDEQVVDSARSSGDDARPARQQPNIIDYLASDRDGNAPLYGSASRGNRHEASQFSQAVSDVFEPITPAGREPLMSDHCFDTFISPVSNPFLFEDPRSLTEIRPIFIYQRIPSAVPALSGGNMVFVGAQGRIAFTDRVSFVINKLGGIGINPSNNFDGRGDRFGFAELWLGPKFTFIRDTEHGRLLAGGLQFQIPVGQSNVYQNTGTLSIVPYGTYAGNFLASEHGSFNGLVGTGYSFSTNNQRSDYYYLSAHLDYDVHNNHRFYPLAELNYFLYTTNGTSSFLPFEGRDLINFGSRSKNSNLMTWALGGRAKMSPNTELGGVFEGPLFGNRDLLQYRFTLDFILRY